MSRTPLLAALLLLALQAPPALAATLPKPLHPPLVLPAKPSPAPKANPGKPSPAPKTLWPEEEPEQHHEEHHHHGGRLANVFLHQAALSMGMSPHDLKAEIVRRGLPGAVTAHGFNERSLVDKMAKDVVARAKTNGHAMDEAKVRTTLSEIWRALTRTAPA